jgi:transposase-like protein
MRFSMPFQSKEEAREELCRLALTPGANRRELCRQHRVQPSTLYKCWIATDERGLVACRMSRVGP